MTIALRPAVPADADAVSAIWYSGWRDGHLGHVPDELVAIRTRESFLEQVYVSRDRRGSGVATALLSEAERLVRANGHDRAWLAVVTGNARARRFYQRSGWTDDGAFVYPASIERGTLPVPCHRYVRTV